MKRILLSLLILGATGALAVGVSRAFFSDTETSTGNTFTAGAIDLSLGGAFTSASNGNSAFALDPNNNGKALYSFTDLKPGDMGGGSFNLEVTSNDAYVCAKSLITATPENDRNYPELNAGDTTTGANEGELQNYLKFATFDDDNENGVYDAGSEPINVGQYLPSHNNKGITAAELGAAGWVSVADTTSPNTWLVQATLPTGAVQSAGLLYCFGDFTTTGSGSTIQVIGCDGSGNQNVAQTDGVVGSIEFSAVQTRNNPNFTCASMNTVHVTSSALHYGPTGWAGWSCPANTTVVDGSLVVSGGDLASTFVWKTGATTGSVTYPNTPFGFTYGTNETGYIGQNDNDSGESIVLDFDCMPN